MTANTFCLHLPGHATATTKAQASPGLLGRWAQWLTELRIDVDLSGRDIQREFDALHDRIRTNHRTRDALRPLPLHLRGLVFRLREADGEYFVYAIDPLRNRIAAYTVFNRLVEVDRRADALVRAPHSKYAEPYQRRGIATALYRWALGHGVCLLSGARQSAAAHALWHKLAQDDRLFHVAVHHKRLHYLGPQVSPDVLNDLHTRLLLLGQGWDLERFAGATQMRGAELTSLAPG